MRRGSLACPGGSRPRTATRSLRAFLSISRACRRTPIPCKPAGRGNLHPSEDALMSRFGNLRHWLTADRRAGQTPKKLGGRRRLRYVPQLVSLEDRTLLSTYLVTNLGDSGAGSLRQA